MTRPFFSTKLALKKALKETNEKASYRLYAFPLGAGIHEKSPKASISHGNARDISEGVQVVVAPNGIRTVAEIIHILFSCLVFS